MQAWGSQSRFTERETEREPTKSGVIGLVCAALGRGREEDVSDLAALRLGVRVDQEGRLERDYHTAGGEDRKVGGTVPTNRYYLADADFLVGLEGPERGFLEQIEAALRAPRWQLYLGGRHLCRRYRQRFRGVGSVTRTSARPWRLSPGRSCHGSGAGRKGSCRQPSACASCSRCHWRRLGGSSALTSRLALRTRHGAFTHGE